MVDLAGVLPEVEKKVGLFSAFVRRPTNIRFEGQEKKEEIILLLRRHFITNVPWLLVLILMVLVPVFVPQFVPFDFLPPNFRLMAIISWYLLTFAFAFQKLLCWLFNVNIITNQRVIDIDFPTILYKDVSDARFDKIQDVSVKTGGFIRSLFNFGKVIIQTAGAIPEIIFEDIPNPERVRTAINKLTNGEDKK